MTINEILRASRDYWRPNRRELVPCELRHYPGVGHGVGLGKGLPCEDWFDRAVSFWEKVRNPQ